MTQCSECKQIGGLHQTWCSVPSAKLRARIAAAPHPGEPGYDRYMQEQGCTCGDFAGTSVRYADCPLHGAKTQHAEQPNHDAVNHPSHYTAYKGLEVIDLTEQMNFNRGNAVKYVCRAGLKDPDTEVEDLEKAVWYLRREITRVKGLNLQNAIDDERAKQGLEGQ